MQPKTRNPAAPAPGRKAHQAELDFGGLDDLLGYHLRRAQGAAYRLFLSRLSSLDLTQRKTAVLWLAYSNPGVSQGAIAAALAMDRATTMAVVDRLQDRGLVKRQRSTSDRRRQEILVTPAGERTILGAQQRIRELEADYRSRFSASELETLKGLLKRIRAVSEGS